MSFIELKDVSVSFPVFNTNATSIKNKLTNFITGGVLKREADGMAVVNSLNSVSFSAADGDRIALVGPNGAGKSTLLRVLNKIYHPTTGTLHIKGSVNAFIELLGGIDLESTGRDNIYLRCSLLGFPRSEIYKNIDNIIDFSELGEFIDLPVRTYSSGMIMRLAFSVATNFHSDILLLDEWLSVGDEGFRNKAQEKLLQVVNNTNILVCATHSPEVVKSVCNRVITLQNGRIHSDEDVDTYLINVKK